MAHCAISNAKLGHGVAPVTEMLDAGIDVGLGSDSMASNNHMDLLAEARAASLAQNARLQRHDALPAATALRLATINGARALGLGDEIGSLEVGKAADLAAFPIPDRRVPNYDATATAIFTMPGTGALFVCVAGRELVRDYRLVRSDATLLTRVADTVVRVRAWAQSA